METFSALLALCAGNSPVTDEVPSQRPLTRSFDIFFDLLLNKRLRKQSRRWWFERPSHSLWRHCSVVVSLHAADYLVRCLNDMLTKMLTGTITYNVRKLSLLFEWSSCNQFLFFSFCLNFANLQTILHLNKMMICYARYIFFNKNVSWTNAYTPKAINRCSILQYSVNEIKNPLTVTS